jgi:hypothetical protein
LDSFLPIRGSLELSFRSYISSAPVLFLHLKLVDYDPRGLSFDLAHRFIRRFFPNGGLELEEVEFDLASRTKISAYKSDCRARVNELVKQGRWSRVVIGVSDHTDDDLGDLFIGYEGRPKKYIGAPVDNVRLTK